MLFATIEGFQSSAQKQMMAEMPRLRWATAGYASACYEVQFTAGQQARRRGRIAELTAVGQESEDSEEDRLKARKLAVMEEKSFRTARIGLLLRGHEKSSARFVSHFRYAQDQLQPGATGVLYRGSKRSRDAAYMTMIHSADVRVEPFYNSVEQAGSSALLWFFAEQPSDWIELIYPVASGIPGHDVYQTADPCRYGGFRRAQRGRSRQIGWIAGGINAGRAGFDAFTRCAGRNRKRRRLRPIRFWKKARPDRLAIAVLEIPALIILVNRAQGVAWNYYTNFLYTDLFHLYGWITAGVWRMRAGRVAVRPLGPSRLVRLSLCGELFLT